MIDVENYIAEIIAKLRAKFGERLVYVGLQGSYLRGEATDTSDVDVMVVLDRLSVDDMDDYRAIVESLPRPDLSCGFICGADDLARWNPLEICHLLHTTRDCFGSLEKLVPEHDERDLRNFVKMSVNNLSRAVPRLYPRRPRRACSTAATVSCSTARRGCPPARDSTLRTTID